MQKNDSAESNLRIRKCGSSLDNNNQADDYGDDIQQTWSIEAQVLQIILIFDIRCACACNSTYPIFIPKCAAP